MSYEGTEQFICKNGHRWEVDASVLTYGSQEDRADAYKCSFCKERATHTCSVNLTNGYDEDDPATGDGPVIPDGFDDQEQVDHYGNKYYIKQYKFKIPEGSTRWKRIKYEGDSK